MPSFLDIPLYSVSLFLVCCNSDMRLIRIPALCEILLFDSLAWVGPRIYLLSHVLSGHHNKSQGHQNLMDSLPEFLLSVHFWFLHIHYFQKIIWNNCLKNRFKILHQNGFSVDHISGKGRESICIFSTLLGYKILEKSIFLTSLVSCFSQMSSTVPSV